MLSTDDVVAHAYEFAASDVPSIYQEFLARVRPDVASRLVTRSLQSFGDSHLVNYQDARGKRFLFSLAGILGVENKYLHDSPEVNSADFAFFAKFYTIIHGSISQSAQYRLLRQFEGLCGPGKDLRELFSDLLISLAYARSGANVSMVDFEWSKDSDPSYEFLVEKFGQFLEVEVKTLSSVPAHPYNMDSLQKILHSVGEFIVANKASFSNCLVVLSLAGRKPNLAEDIMPSVEHCLRHLSEATSSVQHGKVGLSFKRYRPENFQQAFYAERQTGKYRIHMLPRSDMPAWIFVQFEKAWKIDRNIDNALEDAFTKFSQTRPSVVWLRFSDMTPPEFRPSDPVLGDAILDLPRVRRVIGKYLEKEFPYPTGIVISPDVTSRPTPAGFQMSLVSRFLPNKASSFDHKRFLPSISLAMPRGHHRA